MPMVNIGRLGGDPRAMYKELDDLISDKLIFRQFKGEERERLLERAVKVDFEKGAMVSLTGDRYPYVIVVSKGLINANKDSAEGRNFTLKSFGEGDAFWGHAMFHDNPTPSTIVAFKPTTVYRWHRDDIVPFVKDNKDALWDLCVQLSQRTIEANMAMEEIVFNPVVNRLARLLVDQFEKIDTESIPRNMTLDEMAAKIGSTREVVCRLLYRLSDENLIQVDRTKFILINKIQLSKMADGETITSKKWS